ncbi:SigB/SigF/SigG family RNA polymerase sigma factor [Streptomyces sp. RK9]|uniref:SigB/SigF/SigG family RNA polymerase sigma factor n=1 Tax=Streptomyces sp. RK9 TaxID=3239284 RepID=UPI003870CACA
MPRDTSASSPRHRPPEDRPHSAASFRHLAGLPRSPERDLLCEELVAAWLPMAHRIARRFRDRGESLDDLRQVAALGLVKAVNRYDPGRGAFESYAVPTITGDLRRHFRDHTWDVRVPRRVQDLRNQVRLARRELAQAPGSPEPTTAQFAERTGLTNGEVQEGMEAMDAYRSLSLEAETATAGDGTVSFADSLGAADPGFDLVVDRQSAKAWLSRLSERERTVLYLRFFQDMTQSGIAEQLGVSQVHVSRLIARSCRQVRAEATGTAG